MKASTSRWMRAASWVVFTSVLLFCCSDPVEEEATPPEEVPKEEITVEEADGALEAFSFSQSSKITGSVPDVANTSLLKMNSGDTIYTLPDIKNLVRISHAQSTPIKGVYVAVKGSTFYYDVPVDDEEDSDTVSVILIEIESANLEIPIDIPVEITPYDENSQPIDIIERVITIEDPLSNECDILQPGDTTDIDVVNNWRWKWTVLLGADEQPIFINAPGRIFSANQKIPGCCNDLADCPAYVVDPSTQKGEWVYNAEVTAGTYYSILYEMFNFNTNGTFSRVTLERQNNFSDEKTDWCAGVAGYNEIVDDVFYYGTHDYVPGDNSISYATTHSFCADPLGLCGYGSRGGQLIFSCHAMIITSGNEGQKEMRMYARQNNNIEPWLD